MLKCFRSPFVVQVNSTITWAFGKLRGILCSHRDLAHRIGELGRRYDE